MSKPFLCYFCVKQMKIIYDNSTFRKIRKCIPLYLFTNLWPYLYFSAVDINIIFSTWPPSEYWHYLLNITCRLYASISHFYLLRHKYIFHCGFWKSLPLIPMANDFRGFSHGSIEKRTRYRKSNSPCSGEYNPIRHPIKLTSMNIKHAIKITWMVKIPDVRMYSKLVLFCYIWFFFWCDLLI